MPSIKSAYFAEQTPWAVLKISEAKAGQGTNTFQDSTLLLTQEYEQTYYMDDSNNITNVDPSGYVITNMPGTIYAFPLIGLFSRILTVCEDRPYPLIVTVWPGPYKAGANNANAGPQGISCSGAAAGAVVI